MKGKLFEKGEESLNIHKRSKSVVLLCVREKSEMSSTI